VAAARLEESQVPAFEAALQQFLVEDRTRERSHKTLRLLQTTTEEMDRAVALQLALADKAAAEIEAQREALQPKLERLRGIRQYIFAFLDTQANNLQDRLVISLHDHVKRIEATLPDADCSPPGPGPGPPLAAGVRSGGATARASTGPATATSSTARGTPASADTAFTTTAEDRPAGCRHS
jgi:hypothetical protein